MSEYKPSQLEVERAIAFYSLQETDKLLEFLIDSKGRHPYLKEITSLISEKLSQQEKYIKELENKINLSIGLISQPISSLNQIYKLVVDVKRTMKLEYPTDPTLAPQSSVHEIRTYEWFPASTTDGNVVSNQNSDQ